MRVSIYVGKVFEMYLKLLSEVKNTLVYDDVREITAVNVTVPGRFRGNTVVVRDVYRRKRLAVRIGHDTASNGRNMVATKRTLHGPFTIVHSSVNGMVPSFTTVVMLDLGYSSCFFVFFSLDLFDENHRRQ